MKLKEMLLQEKVIKIKEENEEPFTLKSGKKSRLFIDIKEASLNPRILSEMNKEVSDLFIELTVHRKYDKIASIAIGAIPIASVLSIRVNTPQLIVRTEKHDRGTKKNVIGDCKGMKVLLIEDVATTGSSIVSAVLELRKEGAICNEAIVIVDREEGAQKLCRENNIKLYSLLTKSDFGITEEI